MPMAILICRLNKGAGPLVYPLLWSRAQKLAPFGPGFSEVIAQKKSAPRGADSGLLPVSTDRFDHGAGLLLLRVVAFVHHFLQQLSRAFLVAHFLVGLGEIELGGDLLPMRIGLRRSAAC